MPEMNMKQMEMSAAGKETQRKLGQAQRLAISDWAWQCDDTVNARNAVKTADEITEIVEDRQVVLDGDDVCVRVEKRTDHSCCVQTLLDIEIR